MVTKNKFGGPYSKTGHFNPPNPREARETIQTKLSHTFEADGQEDPCVTMQPPEPAQDYYATMGAGSKSKSKSPITNKEQTSIE